MRQILVVLAFATIPYPVNALSITVIADAKALLVHDCGVLRDEKCTDNERHFAAGDADRVRNALRETRYREVWLYSGGGLLDEGIQMARVFHALGVTVRVPGGCYCVSACTVAFIGGIFRYVDTEKGATYQVHSASRFLEGVPDDLFRRLRTDPAGELQRFASEEQNVAGDLALELFQTFQMGLLRPGQKGVAPGRVSRQQLVTQALPYLASNQIGLDARRIEAEGRPAAQQILQRLERDSMDSAIEQLRAIVPELGDRAQPALNMLAAMYSSRIENTNSLSLETLQGMGYVTVELKPER